MRLLKHRVYPNCTNCIKIKAESPSWGQVQTVLSRGDASVAPVLAAMEDVSLAGWRRAVVKNRLDVDLYAHTPWDLGRKLPWETRTLGMKPGYLEEEWQRALGLPT